MVNIVNIPCAGSATAQLLITAYVFVICSVQVEIYRTFDTITSNLIEVWCSAGAAISLIMTAGFVYGESNGWFSVSVEAVSVGAGPVVKCCSASADARST